MTTRDWADERAERLALEIAVCSVHSLRVDMINAALREAGERGALADVLFPPSKEGE